MKQGLTVDNNTSSSQQDVRITYTQQASPVQPQHAGLPQSQPQNIPGSTSPGGIQQISHSPGHYVYQQPHSPLAPASPVFDSTHKLLNFCVQSVQLLFLFIFLEFAITNASTKRSGPVQFPFVQDITNGQQAFTAIIA